MNIFSTLMEADLERFEQVFFYRKKSLEEFLNLMEERAQLEENYSKAMERISTGLAVYSETGPLADIFNSLKSYHALKSEQSKTFENSLREDIIKVLKENIKKETNDARKFLNNGRKNDIEMKIIFEKIENTKRKYIAINNDTEEAQKTKAFLYNTESNDPNIEEKRKSIFEKIEKLTNARFDCDIELKNHIDEYNNFKNTFVDQCNNIVDHFKSFDARRLENFKDASMKLFVYEISQFRNIQYDVNKLIQNVETTDLAPEAAKTLFARPPKEVASLDFEKFKETYINKVPEQKSKRVIFDKNQINENLGTAFKSLVGFFSNKSEAKQTEENRTIDMQWSLLCQGQDISEADEQNMMKLLAHQGNRRFFLNLIAKIQPANLNGLTEQQYTKLQEISIRIFQSIMAEAWQSKDFESLKLYVFGIKRLIKEEGLQGKRSLYKDLDTYLLSLEFFNNEEIWREYLIQSMQGGQKESESRDPFINLGKLLHELAVAKHFLKNKERVNSLIKSVKTDLQLSEQDVERITEESSESSFSDIVLEENKEKDQGNKENENHERFDDWVQKMQQKIKNVERTKKIGGSIFSTKARSDPSSPLKKRIFQEDIPEQKHAESDKTQQPSVDRMLVDEPNVEAKKEEEEGETNVSVITGSTLSEIQELNTNNMA